VSAPILQLVVAPLLVGVSTLAARRWGQRIGGLLSAFPAIVGPLLLIAVDEHGPAFAARAATGTLLGLVALSGFVLAYGRTASRAGWRTSLIVAWTAAGGIAALVATIDAGPGVAMAGATASLVIAHRLLPNGAAPPLSSPPRWDLPLRLGMTAVLIISLTAVANSCGPLVGGVLAALPALACILAVVTHGQHGNAALVALLRGMLIGMVAFALFCFLIAVLVERAGVGVAFAAATLAAVFTQAAAARWPLARVSGPVQ
jgi:hypothetical protein